MNDDCCECCYCSTKGKAFERWWPGECLIINEDVKHKCNNKCNNCQTQASTYTVCANSATFSYRLSQFRWIDRFVTLCLKTQKKGIRSCLIQCFCSIEWLLICWLWRVLLWSQHLACTGKTVKILTRFCSSCQNVKKVVMKQGPWMTVCIFSLG